MTAFKRFLSMRTTVIYLFSVLSIQGFFPVYGQLQLTTSAPKLSKGNALPLLVSINVKNTSPKETTLLKDPRGLLSPLPTDIWTFRDASGKQVFPRFIGARVKARDADSGRRELQPDILKTLQPGQSTLIEHDLSKVYDLSNLAPGAYNVTGNNTFYIINGTSGITVVTPASLASFTIFLTNPQASSTSEAPSATEINSPTVTSESLTGTATPTTDPVFIDCTSDQSSSLVSAAQVAQAYARESSAYAAALSAPGTERYSTWFGLYAQSRRDLVAAQFAAISTNDFGGFTYDCGCDMSNVYAYVYPNEFGRIYLCGAFWDAPMNGTDSKGGTLIHEASHFVANAGGTQDYSYGQQACQFLALVYADRAVLNADSHEYFAENNPLLD